jgi:DNA-binding transcriptional regulator LsrR (DeoR family)
MIQPKMIVGIGRGRTLAELAYGLSRVPNNCYDLKLVQLLGDIDINYSPARSTEITRLLSETYNGKAYYLNAPALVADVNLGMALMKSSTIQQVVRFYNSLDFAIAGVGTLANSPLVISGLLRPADIRKLARAGAVGDICGHFYNINGDLLDHVYSGIAIGISWEQLRNCGKLLVVATGKDKVEPLLGILRTGTVDILVTDENTAQELLRAYPDN